MSKKGAVQQLQTDINTDEELNKFLEKDGLLLLEVYTAWCGPCLAMVGNLKKIKLDKGGDDLILSIVKADTVERFSRFRNKSEPTWLLASNGHLINGMFGTNVPELMKLISDEIDREKEYQAGKAEDLPDTREHCEMNEMLPFEVRRYKAKQEIEDRNALLEKQANEQMRIDYIESVTEEINERLFDMGVTVIMPHAITKDMVKKLPEHGEKFGLSAKDKRMVLMKETDLEWINYRIDNPLPDFVLRDLYEKECLMFCWRNADAELKPVEEILHEFVDYLRLPQEMQDDFTMPPLELQPILKSMEIKVNDEEYQRLKEQENEWDANARARIDSLNARRMSTSSLGSAKVDLAAEQSETSATPTTAPPPPPPPTGENAENPDETPADGEATEATEAAADGAPPPEADGAEAPPKADEANTDEADRRPTALSSVEASDVDDENAVAVTEYAEDGDLEKPHVVRFSEVDIPEEEQEHMNTVQVLPVWTPTNKTANAALIYLYFRVLTDHFLPPDPIPDPPHIAVVFDVYKRNDIMNLFAVAPTDILAYGYFTSETPGGGTLLANSTLKYEQLKDKSITDKMVVKVSKKTSNTLLSFTSLNPCYVSLNTIAGEEDCKQFFPEGFKNSSEDGEDEDEEEGVVGVEKVAEAAVVEEAVVAAPMDETAAETTTDVPAEAPAADDAAAEVPPTETQPPAATKDDVGVQTAQ